MRRRAALLLALAACTPAAEHPGRPSASASVAVTAAPPPAARDVHLSERVVPRAYRLELDVDPRRETFRGKVAIDLELLEATRTIVLHGRDLTIASATLKGGPTDLPLAVTPRPAFGARAGSDELVLTAAAEAQGARVLEIAYEARFGVLGGLYRVESGGNAYAFTQFEPIDARAALPCFDEPVFKTPFTLAVAVPRGMVAVSSAPELRRREADGRVRFEFAPTAPLPTYLLALAVGDLESRDGLPAGQTPLRLLSTRGNADRGVEALAAARASLVGLESYFGRPYPFQKVDIAAVPNFGPGAMENVGLVTFREELVLMGPTTSSAMRRRMQAVMAHELAHQWFGNLVTMRFWDDLWLNEGFATWMAAKICDQVFPGFGAQTERVLDRNFALNADVLPAARAVRPRVSETDQIREAGGWSAYQKGSAILFMLESWAGEDVFRDAIRRYVNDSAGRSITSRELVVALDERTKLPMSKVAASFLDQPGVPLIDVAVSGCEGTGPVRIELRQRDLSGAGRRWAVPVCASVEGEPKPRCLLLEEERGALDLGAPKKRGVCPRVHPNAGESGYYRYRLDAKALARLGDGFGALPDAERIGLLLDGWALFLAGEQGLSQVFDLLEAVDFQRERSRALLDAAIWVLADVDRVLVDDATRPAFRAWIRRKIKAPPLPKPDVAEDVEQRLRRVSLYAALADLGDDRQIGALLEPMAETYGRYRASFDADLLPLALRVSARWGGAGAAYDAAKANAAPTADERVAIEAALGSRGDAKALRAALEGLADGTLRGGDFRHLRTAVLRRPDSRAVFYAFVRERFDVLADKVGNAGALTATTREICDKDELARMVAFLEPKLGKLSGAQRGYDEGVAEAKRCLAVREAHKAELAPLLERR